MKTKEKKIVIIIIKMIIIIINIIKQNLHLEYFDYFLLFLQHHRVVHLDNKKKELKNKK